MGHGSTLWRGSFSDRNCCIYHSWKRAGLRRFLNFNPDSGGYRTCRFTHWFRCRHGKGVSIQATSPADSLSGENRIEYTCCIGSERNRNECRRVEWSHVFPAANSYKLWAVGARATCDLRGLDHSWRKRVRVELTRASKANSRRLKTGRATGLHATAVHSSLFYLLRLAGLCRTFVQAAVS